MNNDHARIERRAWESVTECPSRGWAEQETEARAVTLAHVAQNFVPSSTLEVNPAVNGVKGFKICQRHLNPGLLITQPALAEGTQKDRPR